MSAAAYAAENPNERYIYEPKPKSRALTVLVTVLVIIVIFAAITAICAVIIYSLSSGNHSVSAWTASDSEVIFIYDEKTAGDIAVTKEISLLSSVEDGGVSFYLDGETLYAVESHGLTEVTDSFESGVSSYESRIFAYTEVGGGLYIYSVSKKESTLISEGVAADILAVSPDGKTVIYKENGGESDSLYIYSGGETSALDVSTSKVPFAVSNSAKYIYLYDNVTGGIYVSDKKGNTEKIAAGADGDMLFNSDNTEMMYSYDGITYCYISKKNEKTKLLLSKGESLGDYTAVRTGFASEYSILAYTTSSNTFSDLFYIDAENNKYYIDGKYESTKIAASVTRCEVSDNGECAVYEKHDTLYMVSVGSIESVTEIGSDVSEFAILPSGDAVYYINSEGALIYASKSGHETEIAEDVEAVYITHDGYALYLAEYVNGVGALYGCRNGKDERKLADDVSEVFTFESVTFYLQFNADYDLYVCGSGLSFSLVIEGCEGLCD